MDKRRKYRFVSILEGFIVFMIVLNTMITLFIGPDHIKLNIPNMAIVTKSCGDNCNTKISFSEVRSLKKK